MYYMDDDDVAWWRDMAQVQPSLEADFSHFLGDYCS